MAYTSKGVRNKSLPILGSIGRLIMPRKGHGLILHRRAVDEMREHPPLLGCSLHQLISEYQNRIKSAGTTNARQRERLRDATLRDAGGLTYKMIENEFKQLATALMWPAKATLKDFRHLCQTALDNGGMTREERQYLLGQSLGTAAITAYIHVNKLPEHYQRAVALEMGPLLQVIEERLVPSKYHMADSGISQPYPSGAAA